MKKLVLILTIVLSGSSLAALCSNGNTYEENLITIFSGGETVVGNIIGDNKPCDGFGGVEVFTPANNIRLYVNFNIAGEIDLDRIDTVFTALVPELAGFLYAKVSLAVVVKKQFKRFAEFAGLAPGVLGLLNGNGQTFFISEEALVQDKLYTEVLPLLYDR